MNKEEKPNVKVTIPVENSNLRAAVNQSVILPKDARAKANATLTAQDPAPNTSALQKATQQCASLPQNKIVLKESMGKPSEKT